MATGSMLQCRADVPMGMTPEGMDTRRCHGVCTLDERLAILESSRLLDGRLSDGMRTAPYLIPVDRSQPAI